MGNNISKGDPAQKDNNPANDKGGDGSSSNLFWCCVAPKANDLKDDGQAGGGKDNGSPNSDLKMSDVDIGKNNASDVAPPQNSDDKAAKVSDDKVKKNISKLNPGKEQLKKIDKTKDKSKSKSMNEKVDKPKAAKPKDVKSDKSKAPKADKSKNVKGAKSKDPKVDKSKCAKGDKSKNAKANKSKAP